MPSMQIGKLRPVTAGQHLPPEPSSVAHEVQPPGAGVYFVQFPPMQSSSPLQTVPQSPQWVASVLVSKHETLPMALAGHAVRPVGQPAASLTHIPLTQVLSLLHTLPHDPQLRWSPCLSTHSLPHRMSGGRHVQALPAHHSSFAQILVQLPHFSGSSRVTAQLPPQLVSPLEHVHVLPTHATENFTSDEHTLPQPPQ